MITLLHGDSPFPPVNNALQKPNGLLAMGGNLSTQRLMEAYRHGIFPWFNVGEPLLWWSPDPRMVMYPADFKISRSLRKTLRSRDYEIRVDSAFEEVMQACAAPRKNQGGTWIHQDMITAYSQLHALGVAHSVEVWINQELVGGLYGVSMGRMFYGESMFSLRPDTSKIALAHLCAQLQQWGYGMIDCQMNTLHLASLGAREIPRTEFIQRLTELIHYPAPQLTWQFDEHEFVA